MPTQDNWRWCNKCQALAFAGSPSLGSCPAGGLHDHAGSVNYALEHSHQPAAGWQSNWLWCNKCQVLTFAGSPSLGSCPAGGLHDHAGSGDYALSHDPVNDAGSVQAEWRWCNKCQSLTFSQNGARPCAAGGTHDLSGSGNYRLSYLPVQPVPAPLVIEAARFAFICKNGQYLTQRDDLIASSITATGVARSKAQTYQLVAVTPPDGITFYIQAQNGSYLSKRSDGTLVSVFAREASEKFKFTVVSGNKVSIQAYDGKYLSAEGGGGAAVNANAGSVGDNEQFQMIRVRNLGSGSIADVLTAPEWSTIQAFVNDGLQLPITDGTLTTTLHLLPEDDIKKFTDLLQAYQNIHTHCGTWIKADGSGVYDQVVATASSIYNYAKKAIGFDPSHLPGGAFPDPPKGYYGQLANLLKRLQDDDSATNRNSFDALLRNLIADATTRAAEAAAVADAIRAFSLAIRADADTLSADPSGLIPKYNNQYGSQSDEVRRLIRDLAETQAALRADEVEYAKDCIIAETTATYAWFFPLGTLAAGPVAGIYGKRAIDALDRIRADRARITEDNRQLDRAYHIMATLQLAGSGMQRILTAMEAALVVIQKLQGIWIALATDLKHLHDSVLKKDIQQELDDYLKGDGINEAIVSWQAVGQRADQFRVRAYVTIEQN